MQDLYKIFQKYGQIESIEITDDKFEGYVTYLTDSSAYIAFTMEKEISVKIAHSSKQPKPNSFYGDGKTPIPKDAILCARPKVQETPEPERRFNKFNIPSDPAIVGLMSNTPNTPMVDLCEINKQFSVVASDKEKPSITLTEAHKILKLMGSLFETLHFIFWFDEISIIQQNMVLLYTQQAAKYCANVQKMTLSFWAFKTGLMESWFEYAFPKLHTLVFLDFEDKPFDANLNKLQCPNLKKLKIHGFGIGLSRSWPTLIMFTAPLLERLKCVYARGNFHNIGNRLPNIKKLTIEFGLGFKCDFLDELANLKKMTRLTLDGLRCDDLKEIVPFIPVLETVKQFKISFIGLEESILTDDESMTHTAAILRIVKIFPNIERFKLEGIELKEKDVSYLKRTMKDVKIQMTRSSKTQVLGLTEKN